MSIPPSPLVSPVSKQRVHQQFIRFFVVGIGATFLHLVVYLGINALFGLTAQQQLALNVSYGVGYALSFIANFVASTRWTFKTKASVGKGVGFAFSHLVNYGLHLLLFNVFLHLHVPDLMVAVNEYVLPVQLLDTFPILRNGADLLPFPIYVVVVPVNFLLVRFFLTKEKQPA